MIVHDVILKILDQVSDTLLIEMNNIWQSIL